MKNEESKELQTFDSQAMVLEETRGQRQELLKNLAALKKTARKMQKEIEKTDLKGMGTAYQRRMKMLIEVTKLNLQIVDSELKIINSSVDSEIAYKSLMVEILKLKEQLDGQKQKPRYTFGDKPRVGRTKPIVKIE